MAFVSEVCVNDEKCVPATCDLGFLTQESNDYNKVSASNRYIYVYCTGCLHCEKTRALGRLGV